MVAAGEEGSRLKLSYLSGWLRVLNERELLRTGFIVALWSLAIASIFAQALYQRSYLTLLDQTLVVLTCLVAGALITDLGRALLGYILAMGLGVALLYTLSTLPASLGAVPSPSNQTVDILWISIIFRSTFPFLFIVSLLASIIGSGLGEKYLWETYG